MKKVEREELVIDCFLTMLNSIKTVDWYTKPHIFKTVLNFYNSEEILQEHFDYLPNERQYLKRFIRKGLSKEPFDDGIDYFAPNEQGLYFVGETHFNPMTDEKFYWVKIGKAKNLKDRMKSYNTHNPMLYRIDWSDEYEKETDYQIKLMEKAIAKCNHNSEWFLVDKETYLEMCDKGFSYFN